MSVKELPEVTHGELAVRWLIHGGSKVPAFGFPSVLTFSPVLHGPFVPALFGYHISEYIILSISIQCHTIYIYIYTHTHTHIYIWQLIIV